MLHSDKPLTCRFAHGPAYPTRHRSTFQAQPNFIARVATLQHAALASSPSKFLSITQCCATLNQPFQVAPQCHTLSRQRCDTAATSGQTSGQTSEPHRPARPPRCRGGGANRAARRRGGDVDCERNLARWRGGWRTGTSVEGIRRSRKTGRGWVAGMWRGCGDWRGRGRAEENQLDVDTDVVTPPKPSTAAAVAAVAATATAAAASVAPSPPLPPPPRSNWMQMKRCLLGRLMFAVIPAAAFEHPINVPAAPVGGPRPPRSVN